MKTLSQILISLSLLTRLSLAASAPAVDWPAFVARQDMLWEGLPSSWSDAPFTGNGTLGAYMVVDSAENALRFEAGNSLVHDHRRDDPSVYGRGRLLIGSFLARPAGKIISGDCRLDLWNAEIRGSLRTSLGLIRFRQYTPSGSPYIVAEAECSGGERVSWEFIPAKADSPRQLKASHAPGHPHFRNDYRPNPAPETSVRETGGICRQPLLDGGETATAWRILRRGGTSVLVATIEHSFPGTTASSAAAANMAAATMGNIPGIEAKHRAWWHSYYPASFISLPDKRIENFYWAQIYKLGSATHPDGCLIDNCGPWLTETPWPNAWWNLNVQLAYWPLLASNHLDLNRPLINAVAGNTANLIANVPEEYRRDSAAIPVATDFTLSGNVNAPGSGRKAQIGCLPWLCHNLWLHYRFSMDRAFLRDTLYPLLRRAVCFYLHFLKEEDDGRLHLAETFSPEYGSAEDCNFDLALLLWGCRTLLHASETLGLEDPLRQRWLEVTEKIAPFPKNTDGMMIGRDTPYGKSHRHYSHLLMFYPLHLLNADQPGSFELMDRSVRHWHGIPGNIYAYSYTGASSMYAAFGKGTRHCGTSGRLSHRKTSAPTPCTERAARLSRPRSLPPSASTTCFCKAGETNCACSPPSPANGPTRRSPTSGPKAHSSSQPYAATARQHP